MFAELIGFFVAALSLLYIYYKLVIFNFWRRRDVFYIEPSFPLGNIKSLIGGKTAIGVIFRDAYMKYKDHPVLGMYTLYKPNLVINDLDLIKIVLTKEFGSFHDRGLYYNEKADPLTGNLFFMPGKKWRDLRVKLTPTFTSGKIKQMFLFLQECGEELGKHLESQAQRKETVDIKEVFASYSTDVIMSAAFGIKSNCIEEPNNIYREKGKKIFAVKPFWVAMMSFGSNIMSMLNIPVNRRDVTSFYMNMFQDNVEYRKANNVVRHDFMNLLIQLMEKGYVEADDGIKETNEPSNKTATKLTLTEATAQSYVFFVAGFETSSTAATYTLYELSQNHDIQDKLRKEIDQVLAKHGGLTYDAVNEMTYLHKIINEGLRKYPTLPMLNRVCTKDITLPTTNIHLPKGTLITIPVFGVHRDPSIYPDPDKFDPERFNEDAIAKRHPYAFLPFGEGPRICIGSRFGYMQIKVALISVLSRYKFNLDPRTEVPLTFDENYRVLVPKGGIHLIVEPR